MATGTITRTAALEDLAQSDFTLCKEGNDGRVCSPLAGAIPLVSVPGGIMEAGGELGGWQQ